MSEEADGSPEHPEAPRETGQKLPAQTDAELEVLRKTTRVKGEQADLILRKRVANGALIVMLVQIALADAGFYLYGHGNGWHIPVAAIDGWLGATVIQIVSVVLVITGYLFPTRSADSS